MIVRHVNVGERDVDIDLLEAALARTLATSDASAGEVSVTLLDDGDIRAMNRDYLSMDRVTDVIAFTLSGEGEPLIGDVYIGYDQARRQAEEAGVDPAEELVRLTVHGTLHVLGHDHPEGPERLDSAMWSLQEELVARILDGHR